MIPDAIDRHQWVQFHSIVHIERNHWNQSEWIEEPKILIKDSIAKQTYSIGVGERIKCSSVFRLYYCAQKIPMKRTNVNSSVNY